MIKLSGHSDDLVVIDGDHHDEVNAIHPVEFVIGYPEATPDTNVAGVRVQFDYAPNTVDRAVWVAAISPLDEDAEIPWPVTVKLDENGYSPLVEIACPPGTPIVAYDPSKKKVWENGVPTDDE